MSTELTLTPAEREKIGVVINNVSVFAAEILSGGGKGFARRALANLAKVKKEHEDLLKHLDGFAREQGDESPLRLIEDLASIPSDVAQMLTLIRRCLLVTAFLGHCSAQPSQPHLDPEPLSKEKRLH